MDLAYIDLISSRGDSILHRSSAIAKCFFTFCMIVAILIAQMPGELVLVLAVLLGNYLIAGVSLKEAGHYALYPAFFSLAFAVFQLTVSITAGVIMILKAVTAALALLLLIFTTPYPEVFALMRRFLPRVLVDAMFFTYRIFFILLKEIRDLLTSIRLKGGNQRGQIFQNIKSLASALGVLFIHSFEMSERMYQVLLIRGYTGVLHTDREMSLQGWDYLLFITGIAVIGLVVIL